jgi:hypothetical protein
MTEAVGSTQIGLRVPVLGQRLLVAALGLAGAAPLALLPNAANQASYQLIYVVYAHLFPEAGLQGFFALGAIILALAAPVLGLLADLVGRRKALFVGVLVLGLALVNSGVPFTVEAVSLDRLAVIAGMAIILVTLPAVLFEAVHSHRFFSSVSGAFLACETAGIVLVVRISQPPNNPPLILISSGIGIALLGIGALGGALVGIAYARGRRLAWPRAWLEADRNPAWLLVAVSALLLAFCAEMANGFSPVLTALAIQRLNVSAQLARANYVTEQGIFILALLAGGVLGDVLAWLSTRTLRRPLGRPLLLLLGVLAQVAAVVLMMLGASWPIVRLGSVLGLVGLGLLSSQVLALLVANVRPRWWGTALGLYTLAVVANGLLINPLWLLVRSWAGDVATPALALGMPTLALVLAVTTVLAALPHPATPASEAPAGPADPAPEAA